MHTACTHVLLCQNVVCFKQGSYHVCAQNAYVRCNAGVKIDLHEARKDPFFWKNACAVCTMPLDEQCHAAGVHTSGAAL
jgi:hypothetical protein